MIFFIPVTIMMTWLYNRSGGNLFTAAIFHAGLNTFPFVLPYAPKMLGLLFVFAAYAVIADRMWRRQQTPEVRPVERQLTRMTALAELAPPGLPRN